jgi:hypothetical protein
MSEPRRASLAPWITAGVAGVVLIALLLVYLLWLRPDEKDADSAHAKALQTAGQLTPTESAAMNAAAGEVVNILTLTRQDFEADYQRALDGATGSLHSDLEDLRDTTLKTMQDGKFDLFGRVTHKALSDSIQSGGKTGYVVLVSINGYRSTNPDVPFRQQNLAVTIIRSGDRWLAADVSNIGVTS